MTDESDKPGQGLPRIRATKDGRAVEYPDGSTDFYSDNTTHVVRVERDAGLSISLKPKPPRKRRR